MLGRDHALTGAVSFLALAPILHGALREFPTAPVPLGIGGVVSAAFALLPDLDEPGSTVSRKLGPLSRAVAKVTNTVAGGHRQATHSILFAVGVFFLARLAAPRPLAEAIIVGCSFLLVFRMLLPKALRYAGLVTPLMLALTGAASWWAFHAGVAPWLAWAAAGGVLWHLVGDSLTVEGVPWCWVPFVRPLQRLRLALPFVGHTGSARETAIGSLLCLGVLYCATAGVVIPLLHTHFPTIQLPRLPEV
ncbi:MAG: metal-dependent hydrolase [Actinomycetota bacterium]|nr:metal-dependent hydrolase [Actinomycetota bacterium]